MINRRIAKERETEERILMALHMRENEHRTTGQIARALGMTRGAVAGILHRFTNLDPVPDRCRRPENRDGSQPPLWWQGGQS